MSAATHVLSLSLFLSPFLYLCIIYPMKQTKELVHKKKVSECLCV